MPPMVLLRLIKLLLLLLPRVLLLLLISLTSQLPLQSALLLSCFVLLLQLLPLLLSLLAWPFLLPWVLFCCLNVRCFRRFPVYGSHATGNEASAGACAAGNSKEVRLPSLSLTSVFLLAFLKAPLR